MKKLFLLILLLIGGLLFINNAKETDAFLVNLTLGGGATQNTTLSGTITLIARIQIVSGDARVNITNVTSGTNPAYLGFNNTVIETTGYPIRQYDSLSMDLGSNYTVWAYNQTGSVDIRFIQVA